MKIEVGDYVRDKDGEIHKIIEINNPNDELWTYYKFENNMGNYKETIIKHSKNIIDLIEVGDYVNGEYITDKWETRISSIKSNFSEEDIKSIVTHEQFENIEYKVETEEK